MPSKRMQMAFGALTLLASSWLLGGCGGGGSAPISGGTLTGSAAVGSSAVSRVGRASVGSLQDQLNRIRPVQGSANLVTRGRQGLDYDEELELYYREQADETGVWIELFADAAGRQPAGEIICREYPDSYETIVNIEAGPERQRAYYRLAETSDPTRLAMRARYEDPRTGERKSIEGDLIIEPQGNPLDNDNGDSNEGDDWTDEFDWWEEEDDYCGDDYYGEDDEFFGEDDFFSCPDETDNAELDSVDDFVVIRFEGTITYEGCGKQVTIVNAQLDYTTGRLTGVIQVDGASGSIDYNYETEQGQIVLTITEGQSIIIQFNNGIAEARYPDGRIERVDLDEWATPCAGVIRAQGASRSVGHTAAVASKQRI